MNEIINTLMNRDGYDEDEAINIYHDLRDHIDRILADSGSYEEVEEFLLEELGLEMDYILDFI